MGTFWMLSAASLAIWWAVALASLWQHRNYRPAKPSTRFDQRPWLRWCANLLWMSFAQFAHVFLFLWPFVAACLVCIKNNMLFYKQGWSAFQMGLLALLLPYVPSVFAFEWAKARCLGKGWARQVFRRDFWLNQHTPAGGFAVSFVATPIVIAVLSWDVPLLLSRVPWLAWPALTVGALAVAMVFSWMKRDALLPRLPELEPCPLRSEIESIAKALGRPYESIVIAPMSLEGRLKELGWDPRRLVLTTQLFRFLEPKRITALVALDLARKRRLDPLGLERFAADAINRPLRWRSLCCWLALAGGAGAMAWWSGLFSGRPSLPFLLLLSKAVWGLFALLAGGALWHWERLRTPEAWRLAWRAWDAADPRQRRDGLDMLAARASWYSMRRARYRPATGLLAGYNPKEDDGARAFARELFPECPEWALEEALDRANGDWEAGPEFFPDAA